MHYLRPKHIGVEVKNCIIQNLKLPILAYLKHISSQKLQSALGKGTFICPLLIQVKSVFFESRLKQKLQQIDPLQPQQDWIHNNVSIIM